MNNREEVISEYKKNIQSSLNKMEGVIEDTAKATNLIQNTPRYLRELDEEFSRRTSLGFSDFGFLFAATALQCIRIYVINELTKVEKSGSGNKIEETLHDWQDRIFNNFSSTGKDSNYPYHASLSHIISARGVPYDATAFADMKFSFFKGANHRFATFGHDPLIGLVIGTTNILTNTITVKTNQYIPIPLTHHVLYDDFGKNPKIGLPGSTLAALNSASDRIDDDKEAVVAALIKQILHIGTDLYTPCGIQIPGANLILSSGYAETLTKYISAGDIIKFGVSYKIFNLINLLISTLHMLTCASKNEKDKELHHVKTLSILKYSNIIATGSNVIFNAVRMYLGDKKAVKDIDFAGLVGTIMLLVEDYKFKNKVKEEFVLGNYKTKFLSGEPYKVFDE